MTTTIIPAAAPVMKTSTVTRVNQARNPQPASGGSIHEWTDRFAFVRTHVSAGAGTGPFGTFPYFRWTNPTSQSILGRGWDTYGNVDATTPLTDTYWTRLPVVSGQPVSINYYVRSSVATTWGPQFRIHNGSGTWLTTATGAGADTTIPANTWTFVKRTYTPTATGYLSIRNTANTSATIPAGGTIDASRLMIEYGTNADNYYFDGDQGVNYTTDWVWSGTPGNSTSFEHAVSAWDIAPSITPDLVLGYETGRESRNIVHDLIGGGIAVALIAPRPRSDTLKLFFTSEAKAWDALRTHAAESIFTLSDTERPSIGMIYVVGNGSVTLALDTDTRDHWVVSVPYQEVEG